MPELIPRNTFVSVIEIKDKEERTTSGGIVLPKNSRETFRPCRIVAVGDGGHGRLQSTGSDGAVAEEGNACADLDPGDVVLVKLMHYGPRRSELDSGLCTMGIDYEHNGQALALVEQAQIVAILEKAQ